MENKEEDISLSSNTLEITKEEKHCINKSALNGRGWTDALIKKYYPSSEDTFPNPFYRCASPMQYFSVAKILEIENKDEFKIDFEKTQIRKQIALERAKKKETEKLSKLSKDLENLNIQVEFIHNVKDTALSNHSLFLMSRGRYDASLDCIGFQNKIIINFIRHNLSNYADTLYELQNKYGKKIVSLHCYEKIKIKYLTKISEVYERYKDDALLQIQNMREVRQESPGVNP